jgi:hypothetical protein
MSGAWLPLVCRSQRLAVVLDAFVAMPMADLAGLMLLSLLDCTCMSPVHVLQVVLSAVLLPTRKALA